MAQSFGQTIAFGALAGLIALASAMPRAHAVEEMRQFNKDEGKKAGNTKSCPSGQRYSEKKRGCVRTSCGTGQVWSSGVDACVDGNSASLSDEDLYLAAGDLVLKARYADALPLLFRIKDRNNPQVLNLIGYSRASSAMSTRASTIITRRSRSIPATPRRGNISAKPIC
jgi:hypothetical protein